MTGLNDIWRDATAYLHDQINTDMYGRGIKPIIPLRIEGDRMFLGVLNEMWIFWLERNFKEAIEEAVEAVSGSKYTVVFEAVQAEQPAQKPAQEKPKTDESVSIRRKSAVKTAKGNSENVSVNGSEPKLDEKGSLVSLDRRFTFDKFVVGDCNRIAFAVSNAVAEAPGTQYNPYFIYSSTGMGKTHLLHSIAQEVLRRTPSAKVMYVTSEEMLNQYVEAMSHNQAMAFRRRYRSLDVLLIDDVQFIGTTQKFQEEFFHTFNALYNAHKQIVMTSDKSPQEINGLEKRLVSRFECGFTAEIQVPDLETRIAIIRKKQEEQDYKLNDDVVRYVAEHLRSSVRRLESGVFKLVSLASISGVKIDVKAAERILANLIAEEGGSNVTVEDIQKVVAEYYDLRVSDIIGERRLASIALPRQIAMYLSRELTQLSIASVAEKFSRKHSTVVHAVKAIEDKIQSNSELKLEIKQMKRRCGNH